MNPPGTVTDMTRNGALDDLVDSIEEEMSQSGVDLDTYPEECFQPGKPVAKRVTMICSNCKSENVNCDATAVWDVDKQDWVLIQTLPNEWCNDCDGETSIDEREL
jgi:hypothetical protein